MTKLYATVAAIALTSGAAWAETKPTPVVPPAEQAGAAAQQAVDAAGKAVDAAAEAANEAAKAAGAAASDAAAATADAAKEAAEAAKVEVKDAAAATQDAAKDLSAEAAAAADATTAAPADMAEVTVAAPEGNLATWFINRAIWTTEQPAGSNWDAYADLKERPAEWKSIAKVEDMVISPEGKVTGYVADIGGFLGIGSKRVLLAPDVLRQMTLNNDTFFATHYTEEELKTLPDFDSSVMVK